MGIWTHNRVTVYNLRGLAAGVAGTPAGGGAFNIHDADIHADLVALHFSAPDTSSTTFSSAASKGDRVLNLVDNSGFLVGDYVTISEGLVREHLLAKVTAKGASDITVDTPLESDYTTSGTIVETVQNINVDGSVTPVVFKLTPPTDEKWHVRSLFVHMTVSGGSGPDDSNFGGIAALPNGVVLREEKSFARNLANWKNGGDIRGAVGSNLTVTAKQGGGEWGTSAEWNQIDASGGVRRLDGALSEELHLIIQDDLTGLSALHMHAQGHREGA